jgi:hypothetical protein
MHKGAFTDVETAAVSVAVRDPPSVLQDISIPANFNATSLLHCILSFNPAEGQWYYTTVGYFTQVRSPLTSGSVFKASLGLIKNGSSAEMKPTRNGMTLKSSRRMGLKSIDSSPR